MKIYDGRKYRVVLNDGSEVSGVCQILNGKQDGVWTAHQMGIWKSVGSGRGGFSLVNVSELGIKKIYELADVFLGVLELDVDL